MLVPVPIVGFIGALITDIAYAATVWNQDSAWERPVRQPVRLLMHLYHFDLFDSERATDVSSTMLDDDEQARKLASELAMAVHEGRPKLIGKRYEIQARNDRGDEVCRVSIDQVPKPKEGS